jgi:hypothetical protein
MLVVLARMIQVRLMTALQMMKMRVTMRRMRKHPRSVTP